MNPFILGPVAKTMEKWLRPGCQIVAITAMSLLLVLTIYSGIVRWRWLAKGVPFDASRWRSIPAELPAGTERLSMAHDLVGAVLKPGMSRQQVEDLVGKPDQTLGAARLTVGPRSA